MKKIYLILAALVAGTFNSNAQGIPNSGFENWTTTSGYSMPDGWDNMNPLTTLASVYTCTKGTPGNPGNSYIKLISKSVSGMGVVPGFAVSGKLDMATGDAASGFAYNQRPTALNGSWQYMAYGSDMGFIAVLFTRWNSATSSRDTISSTVKWLDGMEMSWVNFSIPINFTSQDNPDSCLIILSSSGVDPVANSYLFVDNLSFAGVTGVNESLTENPIRVYPNPVSSALHITNVSNVAPAKIVITDLAGREWINTMYTSGEVYVDELHSGVYILQVEQEGKIFRQKFSKE